MMIKKIFKIITIICLFILIIPTSISAETLTYGQVLDELETAKAELKKHNDSLGNTQGQIQQDNSTIKRLRAEIEEMKEENTRLQQEIAQANIDIENKKQQTKDILVYLQMSQGENTYMEYIFGGDTVTDLVYRVSIVEQITEYNETVIKEQQQLIEDNENKKIELAKNEEAAEAKIQNLNDEIAKLNQTVANLNSLSPSLKDEVEAKESLAAYYKKEGCSNRSDIIGVDCATTSANATFSRPIQVGYVTSFTGYRYICVKGKCSFSFHKGIDIGSSTGKNTPLYSIGNGVVTKKWNDTAGAICINVRYKDTKGTYYTAVYCHLSRYASGIRENMEVTPNTILGYMGDTGNVTGVHLHLEVYPCRLWEAGQCSSWNQYVSFAEKQFNSGYKGAESVINFPSRTYQTWYTK